MVKIVKQFPKEQVSIVRETDINNNIFHITTDRHTRDVYYLYQLLPDNTYQYLGQSNTPTDLEEKYIDMGEID